MVKIKINNKIVYVENRDVYCGCGEYSVSRIYIIEDKEGNEIWSGYYVYPEDKEYIIENLSKHLNVNKDIAKKIFEFFDMIEYVFPLVVYDEDDIYEFGEEYKQGRYSEKEFYELLGGYVIEFDKGFERAYKIVKEMYEDALEDLKTA